MQYVAGQSLGASPLALAPVQFEKNVVGGLKQFVITRGLVRLLGRAAQDFESNLCTFGGRQLLKGVEDALLPLAS